MLESLKYHSFIKLSRVPIAWLPLIQLFDPYLPQFPIFYIHKIIKGKRIYGFPVFFDVLNMRKENCDLRFFFLSNKDIDSATNIKKAIGFELAERTGLINRVTLRDLISSCNKDKNLERMVSELWNKNIKKAYGNCLPFGRLYEEFFSILRFTAAFNPSSGRKSEMQMVYDFISNYGEKISINPPWEHLEFFLLPTYDDLLEGKLIEFPKFKKLYAVMMKFFDTFYTEELELGKIKIKLLPSGTFLTTSNGNQFRAKTENLRENGRITPQEKQTIDFLLDAFNRYPPRVRIFITFVCNINQKNDYRNWGGDTVKKLYSGDYEGKGMSPKVLSCFLQQGFGNSEVVPIDNWVESFYRLVFNIGSKEEFLNKFSKIGKLERLLWTLSQARKTNSQLVFDQLWCIKYGTPDDKLRGPNPLSCYLCCLKNSCFGFASIKKERAYITNNIKKATPEKVADCRFVVEVENNTPKKVYIVSPHGRLNLIDIYSGYFLHGKTVRKIDNCMEVQDFIKNLQSLKNHGNFSKS
jgi:hypothetical protein